MSEKEEEGEVDEKLPSSAEELAGTTARPWVGDWDAVKSRWVQLGSQEMGLSTTKKLRQHDQIDDGFEQCDQIDGAVGRGLDLGFIGDSSLRPLAWAWCE